jgi:hypothetical protein
VFADVLRSHLPGAPQSERSVLLVAEPELRSGQVDVVRASFGRKSGRRMPGRRPFHGRRTVAQFDGDREAVDVDRR